MKKLKDEENNVCKEKKLCLSINEAGFTLIELMVSSAIGVFVSLGIAVVFIFAIQQFTILIEKNEAEENHLWTTYYMRLYLGQAVRVQAATGNPALVAGVAPTGGYLRTDFNARVLAPANTIVPFSIFERENGVNTSEFQATGIFIKGADRNGASTYDQSYAVIFDLGCLDGSNPCSMLPTRNDLHFDRISEFQVLRSESEGTNLKSVVIRVSTRFFNRMQKNNWCYSVDNGIGNCESSYKDVTSDIQITLRNNVLATESLVGGVSGRSERAHGGIYYYFPFLPRPTIVPGP